jgi:ankyrin repeat protein
LTSTTDTVAADTAAVIAVALPGTALILATALMLAGLLFGLDPLWRVEPLTLAEAAALRDNGEVVRLINAGADPNEATTVRAEFLRNDPLTITPLEAAVGSDRVDMVELLLDHGAVLDPFTWTRLMCFAIAIEAEESRALLEQRRPAGSSLDCDHVRTPW